MDAAPGDWPADAVLPSAGVHRDSSRIAEDTTPPFPPEQPVLDEPSRIAMEG